MEQMPNLSNLVKFLHKTLVFTEEVKNVLKSNCDEAMFCLKPWCMDVISEQQISKDACTCPKSESEIEEIAAGISRALLQTQQLREKLSLNVVAEKKFNRFNMYDCSQENDNKEWRKEKNFKESNKSSKPSLDAVQGSSQKMSHDNRLQNEIGKRIVHVKSKETKSNSKGSMTYPVKLTESKNFLAINKRSIKNMTIIKQRTDTDYGSEDNPKSSSSIMKSKCIKFAERRSAASTSELRSLIQKVSNKSSSSTVTSGTNVKCPLHGNISSSSIYKQNSISVNIIDGLSMVNIPGEIIKSLKVYHSFLDTEHSKKLPNEKQQKVFQKFLEKFNKMDKIVQEKLANRNYNMTALPKFLSLFQPLFSKSLDTSALIDIKATYAELNPECKVYEMNELNSRQILKSNTTGWMQNGIWNYECYRSFEGISKACCIRYMKKDQLLSFFIGMQQLQHTHYNRKLIKIIVKDVLPYMQNSFISTQSEYAKMYKMIFILQQGLKTKVPVLVRTDK